jgi:hypothetical protein
MAKVNIKSDKITPFGEIYNPKIRNYHPIHD